MRPEQLVKEAPFEEVLKRGFYEDQLHELMVCNLCGLTVELRCDATEHLIERHMDDVLPEEDVPRMKPYFARQ
jgi:hypothetical protein